MEQIGVPKAFAGLVIVAIAGNAVENTAGIVLALKGEADLAISVVKNSVAQITAFLFPALVLVSLLFATPLTFALAPVYIGALPLTALALWQITGDGEATMFEGVALISLYVILAVVDVLRVIRRRASLVWTDVFAAQERNPPCVSRSHPSSPPLRRSPSSRPPRPARPCPRSRARSARATRSR